MTNRFETWLAAMRQAGKGGYVFAASRGRAWSLPIALSGDWSGATIRGQVRIEPDASGATLADIAFTAPAYDAEADETSLIASLAAGTGADSTGNLPNDDDGNGIEHFPIDILVTPDGGDEEVLVAGVLELAGAVTQ